MVAIAEGGGGAPAVKRQLCWTLKLGSFDDFRHQQEKKIMGFFPFSFFMIQSSLFFTMKIKMGPLL